MTKQSYLSHSKIDIYFKQSKDDFVVDEIPLYPFSGSGEHIVLKIRKKDLTSWQMISDLSNHIGCNHREFGYAGLKDKNALTTQYISINKKYEERLSSFSHNKIKILDKTYHNNKIKIGHLKANKFFIRLKRAKPQDIPKLNNILQKISQYGMPNYFGEQRFGIDGDNYKYGQMILKGEKKEKNKKLKKLFISAYQSYNFNNWLNKRVEISNLVTQFSKDELKNILDFDERSIKQLKSQKHPFKLMLGDIMNHYPYGKTFELEHMQDEVSRFEQKLISPTGLLCGIKTKFATKDASVYEKEFLPDFSLDIDGSRRYAWVFPQDIKSAYKEEKNHFEVEFILPKGSYATELIRIMRNSE
ncbi:MAG: tRNA pseudouridine(13) synthase TruD [Campylobacteraceae bacterium 4484_166]|nr:MAG: tRNA pseudouridine(13) synthase TruD [Campylobacteraceae bacterium 4484_166]